MQIISNDKIIRSNTLQGLKDFISQSFATEAKKVKQLVSMMPPIKKAFDLMGYDIVELSTKNKDLENKTGSYNEKWLEESKQFDDDRRANLIML